METMLSNPYVIKGIQTLGLTLVVFLLAGFARRMTGKGATRSNESHFAIKYSAMALVGIGVVFIWLDGLGPILTALTIVAAALTIVSKELLLNFIGSFVIFWRELFAIGDRVQVGDSTGDVIDKGLLFFTLLEVGRADSTGHSTGRLIKVPNALALTLPIVNATRGAGYVWHEVTVAITRESDREAAKKILLAAVEEYYKLENVDLAQVQKEFERKRIVFKKISPRAYLEVVTGGIAITVRYLSKSRLTRESHDHVVSFFLDSMEEAGVALAEMQPK